MGTCPDVIKRLIDRFNQQSDQVRSPDYNETQLRIDFVNPLFRLSVARANMARYTGM